MSAHHAAPPFVAPGALQCPRQGVLGACLLNEYLSMNRPQNQMSLFDSFNLKAEATLCVILFPLLCLAGEVVRYSELFTDLR